MRKPDFFIVGAPRCGTTAMWRYLKEHPEIFMPDIKGPHYFGSDYRYPWSIPPRNDAEYLSLFKSAKDEKRVGEASDGYFLSDKAAEEIYKFNPEAKIIIMLRNPVDLLYSLYYKLIYTGYEHIKDFSKALMMPNQERRKAAGGSNRMIDGEIYWRAIKFSERIEQYRRLFGKDTVKIIIYDDFSKETEKVYGETLRFLEVNENFLPAKGFEVINPNSYVRIKKLKQIINYPPPLIHKWSRILIPKRYRIAIRRLVSRLNVKQAPRPPLEAEVRKWLQKRLLPEVEKVSQLIERDLTHWCLEEQG